MDILDILSKIRSRHKTMTETTKNTTQTTKRLDNSAEKKHSHPRCSRLYKTPTILLMISPVNTLSVIEGKIEEIEQILIVIEKYMFVTVNQIARTHI